MEGNTNFATVAARHAMSSSESSSNSLGRQPSYRSKLRKSKSLSSGFQEGSLRVRLHRSIPYFRERERQTRATNDAAIVLARSALTSTDHNMSTSSSRPFLSLLGEIRRVFSSKTERSVQGTSTENENENVPEEVDQVPALLSQNASRESLHSNTRSRVTSWSDSSVRSVSLQGPTERNRLSVIKEDGGVHQPSSSAGRHIGGVSAMKPIDLNHVVQPVPPNDNTSDCGTLLEESASPPISTPGRLRVQVPLEHDGTPSCQARLSRPFNMDVPSHNRPFDSMYLGTSGHVDTTKDGRLSVAPPMACNSIHRPKRISGGDLALLSTPHPASHGTRWFVSAKRAIMQKPSKRMVSDFLKSRRVAGSTSKKTRPPFRV
jgi:hypothetical protein